MKLEKPCGLCKGQSTHRCIICGWKVKKAKKKAKKDMSERERFLFECKEEQQKYLRETLNKLVRFNMSTTEIRSLDLRIIKEVGDWLSKENRAEEEMRYAIEQKLLLFMQEGSDVYADQLYDEASRWLIPEAIAVSPKDWKRVRDGAVTQFIKQYTMEES